MVITETTISGLVILEPKVHGDDRGFFIESYNKAAFEAAIGYGVDFVQDNHSKSSRGVLRGLHYQLNPHAQGKLVRCIQGEVFDVAVDIRKNSSTFGHWVGVYLSAENKKQFWISAGFAHGFVTLSDTAEFVYKTTDYYAPECDACIAYNDPDLAITWPDAGELQLSEKDKAGKRLIDAKVF